MHHKVFGKVTTKKEKNDKKKKKQEIGNNFLIDFLFFIPHVKSVYILEKRTDPRIGSRWLAGKSFGWRSERNRCGEAFLTPTVTFGHVYLEGKKKKQPNKMLLLLQYVPDSFNHEHLQLWTFSKKWTFILKTKSERTSNNEFCLAGSSCPCPLSSLPFLYSPYLWFLIVA